MYTHPLSKKRLRVSKPTRTCKIFLAFVHDLTFLSCVQGLLGKACFHRHLGKKKTSAGAAACLNMLISSSPWQRPHFSIFSPKLGRELYSPPPFLKKRTHDPPLILKNRSCMLHDKDFNVSSCVQDLAKNIYTHMRFSKQWPRCRSLPGHARFC